MNIVRKIILLILLLVALNWFYENTEYKRFLEAEADQLLQVEKIKSCEIIYTSESSNFSNTEDPNEWDKRKISQMLAEYFPSMQLEAINQPASHAHTHLLLLSMLPENARVKTVVATINLRSFSASWVNSNLESALNKSSVMYVNRPPLFNRALISFHGYDSKSTAEREEDMLNVWRNEPLPFPPPRNTVFNWCAEEKWGDWRDPKRQLTDQFIKQYALVVDSDHPRTKDFDAIVSLCENRGWNLMFHILPENIQTADSLAGDNLSSLMRQNANWLEQRYARMGVIVINNLELLEPTYFTDKDFPTEHYNARGRWLIARELSVGLKKIHSDNYQPLQ